MIFGILEILLGCFAALMIPLSIFGQMMAAKQQGHVLDPSVRIFTFLTFAIFAVGFIWFIVYRHKDIPLYGPNI